jgi:hypothetical protein
MASRSLFLAVIVALLGFPLVTTAQQVVRPSRDVTSAALMAVPIDPMTRVDSARFPSELGRRALEPLGLEPEQLQSERSVTYSATHLEDGTGELAVFYVSLVKQRDRWVLWSEDLPQSTVRATSEVQRAFDTTRDARYLVDFTLDSAEQEFAVVSDQVRTTQAPVNGHLALIVSGTGKRHKVRILPLGDSQYSARHFTLFHVTVTPLM